MQSQTPIRTLNTVVTLFLGSLDNDDGNGNENRKKTIGLLLPIRQVKNSID